MRLYLIGRSRYHKSALNFGTSYNTFEYNIGIQFIIYIIYMYYYICIIYIRAIYAEHCVSNQFGNIIFL